MFRIRSVTQYYAFLQRRLSEVSIQASLDRLTAIRAAVEKQKQKIDSVRSFRLSEPVSQDIERFLLTVYRHIPPPIDSSNSIQTDPPKEASLQRLVEVEFALQNQLKLLQEKQSSPLTPQTIQSVEAAIKHLEKAKSSILISHPERAQKSKQQESLAQNLRSEIDKIHSLGLREIAGVRADPTKHSKLKSVLNTSASQFQEFYSSRQSQFDLATILYLIEKIISLSESSERMSGLVSSAGPFLSQLFNHSLQLAPEEEIEGIHFIFATLGRLSGHLSHLRDFLPQMNHLLYLACNQDEDFINKTSPVQIELLLRTLLVFGYDNCTPLLKLIAKRVKGDLSSFSQSQLLLIIHAMATFRFAARVDLVPILSSIKANTLSPVQIQNYMLDISKLPLAGGESRKFFTRLVKEIKYFLDRSVEFSAYEALWRLAVTGYFPGQELLDQIAYRILEDKGDSTWILASSLLHFVSLQYCPPQFLQTVKEHWTKRSFLYSLPAGSTMAFALCMLKEADQQTIDVLKIKLRSENPYYDNESVFTKLARIHMYCERVLKLRSPLEGPWKELSLQKQINSAENTILSLIPIDLRVVLLKMGYVIQQQSMLKAALIRVSPVEKDGLRFAVEFVSWKNRIMGERPVLRVSLQWRHHMLGALGFGIITVDFSHWSTLKTEEKKIQYLEEMTTSPGQESKLLPDAVAMIVKQAWNQRMNLKEGSDELRQTNLRYE